MEELSCPLEDLTVLLSVTETMLCLWKSCLSTRRSVLYQFTFPITILLSITETILCLWKCCLIYYKVCSIPIHIPCHNSIVYYRDNVLSMEELSYLLEHLFCTNSHSLSHIPCHNSIVYYRDNALSIEELSYLLEDLFCTNSHSLSQFYCLLQRQCSVYGRVVLSTRRSVLYQFTLPVTILLSITETMSCLWKSCLIY